MTHRLLVASEALMDVAAQDGYYACYWSAYRVHVQSVGLYETRKCKFLSEQALEIILGAGPQVFDPA